MLQWTRPNRCPRWRRSILRLLALALIPVGVVGLPQLTSAQQSPPSQPQEPLETTFGDDIEYPEYLTTPEVVRTQDIVPRPDDYPPNFVPPDDIIALVDFRDQTLNDVIRAFAEQSKLNIVASAEANKVQVNLFLHDVRAMDVLENLTKTHDLYFRIDERSGIIRIFTTKEYEANLASFRDEQTQVFTLLYPNPVDVAVAIRDLFGERVRLNFGIGDEDSVLDLVYRLNRFDLVDGRSLGLGAFQGSYNFGARPSLSSINGLGGFSSTSNNARRQFPQPGGISNEYQPLRDLGSEQIQTLIQALQSRQAAAPQEQGAPPSGDAVAKLLEERQATIYVTVVRRNNQVVVRTGDQATMTQIEELIRHLDVPTPLVLLEVKVMSITLDDDFRSMFDFEFSDGGTTAASFTSGDILPTESDQYVGQARRTKSMLPQGAVLNQGDFTFQVVSNSFRARMQTLEDDNRVTVLNTPLLLTANNEVSRIFIGDTIPFTVGFNAPQVIAAGNNNTTITGTPITELRDVGQSLFITPSINADRTVTLRIIQENARRVTNGGRIPLIVPDGTVINQPVDTVNRSTISGTIVAKDGLAVALGGLIEEQVMDMRTQIPVLGKLPYVGILFRNQETGRSRRELVVMIRPYIFNTPSESACLSKDLVATLSVHPIAGNDEHTLNTFTPDEVVQVDLDECQLHKEFRFHNVVPKRY